MKPDEFAKLVCDKDDSKDHFIGSPPTDAQEGLNILIEHFLGKDWYSTSSITNAQVNTDAIYEILKLYPGKDEKLINRIKNKIIKCIKDFADSL